MDHVHRCRELSRGSRTDPLPACASPLARLDLCMVHAHMFSLIWLLSTIHHFCVLPRPPHPLYCMQYCKPHKGYCATLIVKRSSVLLCYNCRNFLMPTPSS